MGHPFRARRLVVAGERPVQVAVVDREIPLLSQESGNVQDGHADECPGEIREVPLVGYLTHDLDAVEFVTVCSGREERRRPVAFAVDDGDGDTHRIAEIRLTDAVTDVLVSPGATIPPSW